MNTTSITSNSAVGEVMVYAIKAFCSKYKKPVKVIGFGGLSLLFGYACYDSIKNG